ncbi:MAG TPA: DedA family protein [Gemmatimonadaceae bacterium]|jgi:membrane protein DedA with SNARE-associated domain
MIHSIVRLVSALGYWGIGLLMAIENVVLPLPSEVIMPLGGFQSARGRLTLVGTILVGTIGSVIGALPLYGLGRALGKERVSGWVDRHGKWILLRGRDLERAGKRFEEHGGWAVFFSQLLPGIRGLISLPAGYAKMNVLLFIASNFAGTLIWCGVLASLGFLLGVQYPLVHAYVGPVLWIVFVSLTVWAIVWLVRRRHAARKQKKSGR